MEAKKNRCIDDKNYVIIRDAYCALEVEFDEETAPPEVVGLIYYAKDILDDALAVYESAEADTAD